MGQGEFNGCNFEDVLWTDEYSVQMESHRRFAAGKSETLLSGSQGTCTGPTFLKARTVCIIQAHDAKTKAQSHPLVNTF